MDSSKSKHFSCDIQTGVCSSTDESGIEEIKIPTAEKVRLIYYTDPICSACWAIEPELKKLKLEYGNYVDIQYKMGGLLPGWEGFADKGNGISKPSDVSHHWDEVGQHSGMSIDGDIWLENPLGSSFPPSIAFKAAQNQGEEFALNFLRKMRELLFLNKQNITEEAVLKQAIQNVGGDVEQFWLDYQKAETKQKFHDEMNDGRQTYGVRGFPTFIFIGKDGNGFKISGMSGYDNYKKALEKAYGNAIEPKQIHYSELELLQKYSYLSTREVAFVLSQDEATTLSQLNQLVKDGKITEEKQKFGSFWRIKE